MLGKSCYALQCTPETMCQPYKGNLAPNQPLLSVADGCKPTTALQSRVCKHDVYTKGLWHQGHRCCASKDRTCFHPFFFPKEEKGDR